MDKLGLNYSQRYNDWRWPVIGAGSVVAKDIPPYAVAAGNPAHVIESRFSPEVVQEMLDLKWWDLRWNELRKKIPWLLSEIEKS